MEYVKLWQLIIFTIVIGVIILLTIILVIHLKLKRINIFDNSKWAIHNIVQVDSSLIHNDNYRYKNLKFGYGYVIIDCAYSVTSNSYIVQIRDNKGIAVWIDTTFLTICN